MKGWGKQVENTQHVTNTSCPDPVHIMASAKARQCLNTDCFPNRINMPWLMLSPKVQLC